MNHRLRHGARLGAGTLAVLLALAGAASAATITQPGTNPIVVTQNGAGVLQPFTITATGFGAGAQVFVEQCDSNPPTLQGYDVTLNCDLGSAPAAATADANGSVTFNSTDPNFRFTPFRGASPQGLFNCLGPSDPSPSNGLDDHRNCQVRVSTSNTTATSDQVYKTLALPNAPIANTPPTVNAGPDRPGAPGVAVNLDGTVTDPDNTPTVQWSTTDGTCSFANANVVDTTFVCPTAGARTVTLTANDGVNPPVADSAIITFTPAKCSDPCVQIGDSMSYEGGKLFFPVTLSTPQSLDVLVTATIVPGTANNPADFKAPATKTVKIRAGKTQSFVTITALRDTVTEADETLQVVLSSPTGPSGIKVGRATGAGVIKDTTSIAPGHLLWGSQSIVETDSGPKIAAKVSLVESGAPSDATMKSSTLAGTATAGVDFLAKTASNTVFKATGSGAIVRTVPVLPDTVAESNETILFSITTASTPPMPIDNDPAVVTILDND